LIRRALIWILILSMCAYFLFGFVRVFFFRPSCEKPVYGPDWRRRVVVLDPGHGGTDPGATGASGDYEKNVNLRYAMELKQHLAHAGAFEVWLTREYDKSLKPAARRLYAAEHGAEVFISIHCNAPYEWNRGYMVIYSERPDTRAKSAALAAYIGRNLKACGLTPDLTACLPPTLVRALCWIGARAFGSPCKYRLMDQGLGVFSNTRAKGIGVLDRATVPAILIEIGYLSNPSEEALIKSAQFIDAFCTAVELGLAAYFSEAGETW
jgi:N-acetylmuramoyl-L-alanine amidase